MTISTPVTVAIVDDEQEVRSGLRVAALAHPDKVRVIGDEATVDELMATCLPPQVVMLDVMLERDTISSLDRIPDLHAWGAKVLVNTKEDGPETLLRAMIDMRAEGVALKWDPIEDRFDAVVAVARGGIEIAGGPLAHALLSAGGRVVLTDQHREILELLADGLTYAEIGRELHIEASTVKYHLETLKRKMHDYEALAGPRPGVVPDHERSRAQAGAEAPTRRGELVRFYRRMGHLLRR